MAKQTKTLTDEVIRDRVYAARIGAGMTQTEVAEAMTSILGRRVGQRTVSQAENSRLWTQVRFLSAFAEATGSSIAWIADTSPGRAD